MTGEAIRALPLGSILADGRSAIAALNVPGMAETYWPEIVGAEVAGPQRGKQLSDEQLEQVAVVYREAWAKRIPVNQAVQEAFSLNRTGAAKRIAKARAAGLLDDVGRGR
jgi:hypothetical protein